MSDDSIEVSVVIPCLNEENTIGTCIRAARKALEDANCAGEVVVADNGSTDRSREIAQSEGARIVEVPQLGYGNAVRTGVKSARGRYRVYLDADLSYDFADVPRFVAELRDGAEFVIGSRFRGGIEPGAMPWLHRAFGTPFLTRLANLLFGCGITDINCGMRGFTAEAFNRLDLQSEGMELCTESIIKAAQAKLRIAEIPIVLHVDQRDRVPHLRSFRDGWRNLQVMMHFCSVWLFLAPGLLLALAGLLVTLAALSPPVGLLIYLAALCCTTLGVQVVLLAITTQSRVRGSKHARLRYARWFQLVSRWVRLEKGLLLGLAAAVGGVALFAWAAFRILRSDNPGGYISIQFDLFATKLALLGTTLFINGLQVFFTSLFLGLFGIRVADDEPERPPDARPRK